MIILGIMQLAALIGGLHRWILNHPNQCENLYLLPRKHPSGRHSEADWSKPDLNKFPKFGHVLGNEVIMKPGDMLYIPTSWFHFIASLNINY